jgi:hypothetical protein
MYIKIINNQKDYAIYSSSVKSWSFLSSSSRLRFNFSSLTSLYRLARYSTLSIYFLFLQFYFINAIYVVITKIIFTN